MEPRGTILPVYFVADESASMAPHIGELNDGLLSLQDALQRGLGVAHQILVVHDGMGHRFQRPADPLVDQLIAEDVLEETAVLANHRVDLPLGSRTRCTG